MKKQIAYSLSLMMGWMAVSAPSVAATATSSMTNTVTIANTCTIAALGFVTTYDGANANATTPQNATATITSVCTVGASGVLTLGQGSNAATGSTDAVPLRRVNSGTNFLAYFLYQDSAHSIVWGNTAGTGVSTPVGTGQPQAQTVYAQLPAAQESPAGTYTDIVLATLTY